MPAILPKLRAFGWTARLALMAAILAAGSVVLPRLSQWACTWGPQQAVSAFVEALKSGDRKSALRLMAPECGRSLRNEQIDWQPAGGLHYRIDSVEIQGDAATVRATLSESGMSVHPEFSLVRIFNGRWLVVGIDQVVFDTR